MKLKTNKKFRKGSRTKKIEIKRLRTKLKKISQIGFEG
jgi:hypothetical protein